MASKKHVPFEIKDNIVKFEDSTESIFLYLEVNLDAKSPREQIEKMFDNLLEAVLDANELEN